MDVKKYLLKSLSVLIVIVVIISTKGTLFSEGDTVWQSNGVVICNATGNQNNPEIISDGNNAAIITWTDIRSGNNDVYAQRTNSFGVVQWTANGISVRSASYNQGSPKITSDGSGGAIIVWEDDATTTYDLYAQRINSAGALQWAVNGVAICTAPDGQGAPQIISDGSGGAIITWHDYRSGSSYDIYAQKINSVGVVQWTTNGVVICNASNNQTSPKLVGDGSGGAIITWFDIRSGNTDIYTQKMNSVGETQWTTNGVIICNDASAPASLEIANDGNGGAIITWFDNRSGNNNIYAQKVNSVGVVQWAANGAVICNAANDQNSPKLTSDGSGGAIITWYDQRSGTSNDIYTQRIDSSGTVKWTANGVGISTDGFNQDYPEITSDGDSGAIITWWHYTTNKDLYAQRINSSGTVQWTTNGALISNAANDQDSPKIISDGKAGAIITWQDNRSGNWDIYSQRIYWLKINSITPDSGYVGTSVEISGAGYDTSQGSGKVYFNGIDAGSATSWCDTKIVINIPANATSGNCTVTTNGQISNTKNCTVVPKIDTITPDSFYIGTSVTITGSGYGSSQGTKKVYFNGVDAGAASVWNSTTITINIPTLSTAGVIGCTVLVNGQRSDVKNCTLLPKINTILPDSGYTGTSVTISGNSFGSSQGGSKVYFNGVDAGVASFWNSTTCTVTIPAVEQAGVIGCTMLVNGQTSNVKNCTYLPKINSITMDSGYAGTNVTISGNGYGSSQGASKVYFNGVDAGVATSWNSTSITVISPVISRAGTVGCTVVVNGLVSNTKNCTYIPGINTISPASGSTGDSVLITGSGYGDMQSTSKVYFNGVAGTVTSWDSGHIIVIIPSLAQAGTIGCTIVVNGQTSNTKSFSLLQTTGLIIPDSGYIGTSVTIYGNGYGDSQGISKIYFNGLDAGTATSWDSANIRITIPSFPIADVLLCTIVINGQASDTKTFTLRPKIDSTNPDSGYVGTSITISGSAFGDSQGNGKVYFNGVDAGVANSWNSTSITVNIPSISLAGVLSCTVLANGIASNTKTITLNFKLDSISPESGYIGDVITISGSGFGTSQESNRVYFNNIDAGVAVSWNSTIITAKIPTDATSGDVVVNLAGVNSNAKYLTVFPRIDSLSASTAYSGGEITITGSGFGVSQGNSTIYFSGMDAGEALSWTSTSIKTKVPKGTKPGKIIVKVNAVESEGKDIDIKLKITTENIGSYYIATQISKKIEIDAGESPFNFEITNGKLPKGLTLNNSTGEISGSASESGEFTFTVKVTDKNGVFETKEFKIEIKAIKSEEKLVVRKNLFNPAKGENSIVQFKVEKKTRVTVKIYNEIGKLVTTLVDREYEEGTFSENWNGKDIADNVVSSGVYLIHIQIGEHSSIKKALVIK